MGWGLAKGTRAVEGSGVKRRTSAPKTTRSLDTVSKATSVPLTLPPWPLGPVPSLYHAIPAGLVGSKGGTLSS